jgi:hypothetical protein
VPIIRHGLGFRRVDAMRLVKISRALLMLAVNWELLIANIFRRAGLDDGGKVAAVC